MVGVCDCEIFPDAAAVIIFYIVDSGVRRPATALVRNKEPLVLFVLKADNRK